MLKAGLIVTLLALYTPTIANAQIDPDPNGMGLYLDHGATVFCHSIISGVYYPVTFHLLATNPTSNYITGWECTIEDNLNVTIAWDWEFTRGTNSAVAPEFDVHFSDEPIIVDSTTIVLASRTVAYIGFEEDPYADFWLSPRESGTEALNGLGYFDGDGTPIPCVLPYDYNGRAGAFAPPSDFMHPYFCEHFFYFAVDLHETKSWGQIKALY
jgi:hypothetical protein